jgi:hypothetical protein
MRIVLEISREGEDPFYRGGDHNGMPILAHHLLSNLFE